MGPPDAEFSSRILALPQVAAPTQPWFPVCEWGAVDLWPRLRLGGVREGGAPEPSSHAPWGFKDPRPRLAEAIMLDPKHGVPRLHARRQGAGGRGVALRRFSHPHHPACPASLRPPHERPPPAPPALCPPPRPVQGEAATVILPGAGDTAATPGQAGTRRPHSPGCPSTGPPHRRDGSRSRGAGRRARGALGHRRSTTSFQGAGGGGR